VRPISEPLSRRAARHAHGHNHDARARHYALRAVRPSPAREEAPEPDVWVPILDITGELELLAIEEGQADLDAELAELRAELGPEPISLFAPAESVPSETATPEPIDLTGPAAGAPVALPEAPAVEPAAPAAEPVAEPALEPAVAPERTLRRPEIVAHRKALRLRHRILGTGLVVALIAAGAAAAPTVFGGSEPQRDVTLTVDGEQTTITTRAATVGDVLEAHQIVLRPGDLVVPAASAEISEDMPIEVRRAFPVTVEIDGTEHEARTARRNAAALKRDLDLAPGLVVAAAPKRLRRGSMVSLRTPHDVSIVADGATVPLARTTALDVAGALAAAEIALGPNDEVQPAGATRLTDGMTITVYRLAEDQVARHEPIAYPTQTRPDANLARGQQRVLQEGRNGTARVVYQVKRRDGIAYEEVRVASEVLTPPTPRIVAVGTKAPAPTSSGGGAAAAPAVGGGTLIQSGTASWYGTGPGPGTCAHLSLPFGTRVRVVNPATGASAICRVADRGPQAWTGHIIDLSPDVFRALASLGTGIIRVQLYRL
jgi:uncharacterized protein YabE (DUF348 family)